MKKITSLCVVLFCIFTGLLSAQESENLPIQSELMNLGEVQNFLSLPTLDMDAIEKEDLKEDLIKEIPYRFGIPIKLEINLIQEKFTFENNNGDRVVRFGLSSPGATSINLIFSEFILEGGSQLHIYNKNKSQVLGAFTSRNNQPDNQFATGFIFDEELIIELYIPNEQSDTRLKLGTAVHGYRFLEGVGGFFNDGGTCNINVICPEGQPWQKEKRSVVMIVLSNNSRMCSGALINNVKEDGRPFILSANHCPMFSTNLFVFNYESAQCSPSKDSNILHVSTGANIRARNGQSDFVLAELLSPPPTSFNAYYAGWDNSGLRPNSGVSIHHPKGDVKKIAIDEKPLVSNGYYASGNDHWEVTYWTKGTTEPASSGAPLFDQNKRIVGQLHGGNASCTSQSEFDYFGKFSISWDLESDSTKQLKYWLDPNQSGATILNGYDPNIPDLSHDAAILGFKNFKGIQCGIDSIYPEVVVKNRGTSLLDSVKVSFYLNNQFNHSIVEKVNLLQGATISISGNPINFSTGIYGLKSEVEIIGPIDQNPLNNIAVSEFSGVKDPIEVELVIQTDDYGDEIDWELLSATDEKFAGGGNYPSVPGGQVIRDTFCLYDACFKYVIRDIIGDGICCGFGSGYYLLREITSGDTLVFADDFKGADSTHQFCIGDSCTISARSTLKDASSPTSFNGSISLEMLSGNPPFSFAWSNGKTTKDISGLGPGIYSVTITDALNCNNVFSYSIGTGTGIHANNEERQLLIYPNPSNGLFTIKGLSTELNERITVFDLSGKSLYTKDVSGGTEHTIQMTAFEQGIYFVRIENEKRSSVQRIILK